MAFKVDMNEAQFSELDRFTHFNDFFTRALKPASRPVNPDPQLICCPVDGRVSQAGVINDNRLFQAKGHEYAVEELLAVTPEQAAVYHHGCFATFYLSPRDYHRIHMPLSGQLLEMTHIPGQLFSVSPRSTRNIARLFARNERLVCQFDTPVGPVAIVLVGALNVASITTVWAGVITPPRAKSIRRCSYRESEVVLLKGQELGRFNMGSTVIVLFPPEKIRLAPAIKAQQPVKWGQNLATIGYG